MKISEIVKREENNKDIIFHKEGMFWRAYEYSAFLFVNNIKYYNVMNNHFKNIDQDIVYIGFPGTYYNKIVEQLAQVFRQRHYGVGGLVPCLSSGKGIMV